MQTKNVTCYPILKLGSFFGGFNLDKGPWVAGGNPRRLWYGEDWESHDIDLYFSNAESFRDTVAILSNLQDFDHRPISTRKHRTGNAISITMNFKSLNEPLPPSIKVQAVILNFYENVTDLFADFDITASKFATDGKTIIAGDDAIKDCDSKIIRLNPPYPRKIQAGRIIKYALYGFDPDIYTMKEMLHQYKNGGLDMKYEY